VRFNALSLKHERRRGYMENQTLFPNFQVSPVLSQTLRFSKGARWKGAFVVNGSDPVVSKSRRIKPKQLVITKTRKDESTKEDGFI
jgi:hypothetical protein